MKEVDSLKQKYYFSMLGIFLLLFVYDSIYYVVHKQVNIYLITTVTHFFLFCVVNLPGIFFLYRPIDQFLRTKENSQKAGKRILSLPGISTLWIFALGLSYVILTFLSFWFFPDGIEIFDPGKVPIPVWFSFAVSITYFYAIYPSFIAFFLIKDYNSKLRNFVFLEYEFPESKNHKKIGNDLLLVFFILGVIPSLIVILDIFVLTHSKKEYEQFMTLDPLMTILVDRFVIIVGMLFAIFLITKSFTGPIHSVLDLIRKVRNGDFSGRAAIITDDEVGELTGEVNRMVKGLQERELIRNTFGKYVNPKVVNHILKDNINLDGEVRTATILVTDIAGYTTLSEKLPPKEIVQTLNEYFTELVGVIQEHGGIVNKFIGDAIFAIFNVPVEDPHHARNAIHAALEIQKITETRTFGKGKKLHTRIGINSGVVLAGNIGSGDRMEYTVIGDEVNVASRLEQLNKQFGTNLLIGENTYLLVKDEFSCVHLGEIQLKGRELLTRVYRVES